MVCSRMKKNCSTETFGAMMMGSPRKNAEWIAVLLDCSGEETRLVLSAGKEMELGIEVVEPAVQRREGIMCVL